MVKIYYIVLILFCLGCASKENEQLSLRQKEQIKDQVKTVADSIWTKWEEVDPEAALQYYSDSPDWVSINSKGSQYDFQSYKRLANQFKNSATAYKWTTIYQDFNVIAKDIVICTWIGKDEATWKTGDKSICDPHAYTLVFKKIGEQWKLFYSHNSGTEIIQKANMY